MPPAADALSPRRLLAELPHAREVLVLTYAAGLDYFERFVLSDARALGAIVTVVSDVTMAHADPVLVRRAGTQYLDARARCPAGAFHPKLVVAVGEEGEALVAIGSGNLTIAGWESNAEIWSVMRGGSDGAPHAIAATGAFLQTLTTGAVELSDGAADALQRVAAALSVLPAEEAGPRLLHSLQQPIVEQLPAGPVDELNVCAPFFDHDLSALNRLLDHLQPARWTAFVHPRTSVDGRALNSLANEREGTIAWISTEQTVDGAARTDHRYWHGKLIEWRRGRDWHLLTGSPNLSAPALCRIAAQDGNLELALLRTAGVSLAPAASEEPAEDISSLTLDASGPDDRPGPRVALLSARWTPQRVSLQVVGAPAGASLPVERYDRAADQWRAVTTAHPAPDGWGADPATVMPGDAVRCRLADDTVTSTVFVTDFARVLTPVQRPLGRARVDPRDYGCDGLGSQLLADIELLRPHLLKARRQPPHAPRAPISEGESDGGSRAEAGPTMEEFVEMCDSVLGRSATRFALLLPNIDGIGGAIDEQVGTLAGDDDETVDAAMVDESDGTLAAHLLAAPEEERARYRRFLERLIPAAHRYPNVARTLAARALLNAIAAGLWPAERGLELLETAVRALGAEDPSVTAHEERAAGCMAALALGILRGEVSRISRRDEDVLRYERAAAAAGRLLPLRTSAGMAELMRGLDDSLPRVDERALAMIDEEVRSARDPLARAVRLLWEETRTGAEVLDGAIVVLAAPLTGFAERQLYQALRFIDDDGPVYVRGRTAEGRAAVAGWSAPWLVVERETPAGPFGRAWMLQDRQAPASTDWDDLPVPSRTWFAGGPRPEEADEILSLADERR